MQKMLDFFVGCDIMDARHPCVLATQMRMIIIYYRKIMLDFLARCVIMVLH